MGSLDVSQADVAAKRARLEEARNRLKQIVARKTQVNGPILHQYVGHQDDSSTNLLELSKSVAAKKTKIERESAKTAAAVAKQEQTQKQIAAGQEKSSNEQSSGDAAKTQAQTETSSQQTQEQTETQEKSDISETATATLDEPDKTEETPTRGEDDEYSADSDEDSDPNFAYDPKTKQRLPVKWPTLPEQLSTESVNTAKDREWWDDEILRCSIVKLRDEELLDYEVAGTLVYSPLEAFSLLHDGEVEIPPRNIKRIFMPLHVDGTHWCLLELFPSDDLQALHVTLFDSLPILKAEDWFQFRWHEVRRAVEGLARCGVFATLGWKAKQLYFERVDRQQTNIYDCGPFTVEFLKKRCQSKRGDVATPIEAAKRREFIQGWLKSGEVYVKPDRATLERIKAETEVIAPSKQLLATKDRLRGRLASLFES